METSRLLNRTLSHVFADPQKRSWYNLFLHLDSDRTGMITYKELYKCVRSELRLSKRELPSDRLLRVWAALDSDASGHLTAGEFGTFMRLAPFKPPETWKQRLHKEKVRIKKVGQHHLSRGATLEAASAPRRPPPLATHPCPPRAAGAGGSR